MSSDEDDFECPLCMEEIDYSDRHFKPCPCGYKICRFCWNHIKENLNGRCPACRREYSDQNVEYKPPSQAENEKKQREREKKEMEANNRRHLANMRVVQKNLVYVIGLNAKVSTEEILKQYEYFGQFGKTIKIVINRKNLLAYNNTGNSHMEPSVGVYVTFARKEDAAKCIQAIDGTVFEGRVLRASYGTTKYCTYYLRGLVCQNPGCMYLHEPGEDADSYTKEEMAAGKHHAKIHPPNAPQHNVTVNENGFAIGTETPFGDFAPERPNHEEKTPVSASIKEEEPVPLSSPSALPKTASWAGSKPKRPRVHCSIFNDIHPGTPAVNLFPEKDPDSLINTASLHRYLLLAQQSREYFVQLTNQMMAGGRMQSAFLFNPFRSDVSDLKPSLDKSRFGFAQMQMGMDKLSLDAPKNEMFKTFSIHDS